MWGDSEAFIKESVKFNTGTCILPVTKSSRCVAAPTRLTLEDTVGEMIRPKSMEPEVRVKRAFSLFKKRPR